jgi:hypothetical protein
MSQKPGSNLIQLLTQNVVISPSNEKDRSEDRGGSSMMNDLSAHETHLT